MYCFALKGENYLVGNALGTYVQRKMTANQYFLSNTRSDKLCLNLENIICDNM